jgi:hypothetical protein
MVAAKSLFPGEYYPTPDRVGLIAFSLVQISVDFCGEDQNETEWFVAS